MMNAKLLVEQLNIFWASRLKSLEIDLADSTIQMSISVRDGDEKSQHQIDFHGVSAILYAAARSGRNRYDRRSWEYVEISEIRYSPEASEKITQKDLRRPEVREIEASPNFYLELWSAPMYIEAKAITIDGKYFEVGYPQG